jgi:hypothetical protein
MPAITCCKVLCTAVSYQNTYIKVKIYRTLILLVVFYGFETWSLTFMEDHSLRVMMMIFGPEDGQGNKRVEKTV